MEKLSINYWIIFPSIQFNFKITSTEDDRTYHDHDFFEIFYILDGTITHNCNGTKEMLETGDVRLLRPKDKHGFERKKNVPCSHRDIIITEQLFKKVCDFIDPSLFQKINEQQEPLKTKIPQTKIVDFEKEFSNLFFTPVQKGIYTKESAANMLAIDLLKVFLQEFQPQHSGLPIWLNNIIHSFSTPWHLREGLDFILKDTSYDKSYICRTFKKYMGCTMTEYLRDQRVDYAMTLLLTTDKTIAQICEEVGFESIPYFTTAFKNKYSLSPKQFKLKFFNR